MVAGARISAPPLTWPRACSLAAQDVPHLPLERLETNVRATKLETRLFQPSDGVVTLDRSRAPARARPTSASSLFAVAASPILGDMTVSREQILRTLASYQRRLEERPDDARTLLAIGDLHLRADEPADAVVFYCRAADVFAKGGKHLHAISLRKGAIEVIRDRAPELTESIRGITELLVASYLALGRTDEAIRICVEGAELLESSGLREDANELRRRAAELSPLGRDR